MAVTDNFTGTEDAALDSAKWTITLGTWVYKSNAASSGVGVWNVAKWIANTFSNDHTGQIIRTGGSDYIGPGVRLTGSGPSDANGYGGMPHASDSKILRFDNGTPTNITNGPSGGIGLPATTGSNPQTYYLSAVGSAITLREGGSGGTIIATATDSTYTSGAAGIIGNDQGSAVRGDDWEGTGEVVAGGGHPAVRRFAMTRAGLLLPVYRPVEIGRKGTLVI